MTALLALLPWAAAAGAQAPVPPVPQPVPVAAPASPTLARPAPAPDYPLVARVPLGGPEDYLLTSMTFEDRGRTVHVSGSKDPWQELGWFMSLTVRGAGTVWVKPGLKRRSFQAWGRTYYVDVEIGGFLGSNALLHKDRIAVELTREGDPLFKRRYLSSQMAARIAQTGRPFQMLGKTFYAGLYGLRREVQGRFEEMPGEAGILLTAFEPYLYDKNKTSYRFESYHLHYRTARRELLVRDVFRRIRAPHGEAKVLYGFQVNDDNELEVYDLTRRPVALTPPGL